MPTLQPPWSGPSRCSAGSSTSVKKTSSNSELARHLLERADLDARQIHRAQEERDAVCLGASGSVRAIRIPHERSPPARAPHLLAVDDEPVAVARRPWSTATRGRCRRRARRRAGTTPARPARSGRGARPAAPGVPKSCTAPPVEHEPDHVEHRRHPGQRALQQPRGLVLGRQALTPELGRPVDAGEPGVVEPALPRLRPRAPAPAGRSHPNPAGCPSARPAMSVPAPQSPRPSPSRPASNQTRPHHLPSEGWRASECWVRGRPAPDTRTAANTPMNGRGPGVGGGRDAGGMSADFSTGARPVRAPRGTELTCLGWPQEAALPDAAEQPRPRGGRATRRPRRLRRHRSRREIVAGVRGDAAHPDHAARRRDDARAVGQTGRRVPHPRVGATGAAGQLQPRARLGHLGRVPPPRSGRSHDVRTDDGRVVDLHRHPRDSPGHLRVLRRDRPAAGSADRWPAPSH